jgi:uncharacterized protein YqeY
MGSLPDRVQADLLRARKARDQHAVTALRTLLAAISNAEAPATLAPSSLEPKVLGLAEHERLHLTDEDHRRILEEQLAVRDAAAVEYDTIGRPDAAAAVRAERAVLERYR